MNEADLLKKKRSYQKTTVTLAPLSVDEALAALLKTPPPPDGESARKGRLQDAQKRAVKRAKRKGR
jgi:hypothetical protein